MASTDDSYQYAVGNYCDSMAISLPLTDKSVVTFGFIGMDTGNPTTKRATGADAAAEPKQTSAFNTSTDIARLRISDIDEDGLSTDFKSATLTFNNSVSPEKVLGQLGAKYLNTGIFEVNIEAQLVFSNPLIVNRIRENAIVSMDFVLNNDDNGSIVFDIPSMTMGGGDRDFAVNESILINANCEAIGDSELDTSIGVSLFPSVP